MSGVEKRSTDHSQGTCRFTGWAWPISLALHALVGALLYCNLQNSPASPTGSRIYDTRVAGKVTDVDVELVLEDPPAPRRRRYPVPQEKKSSFQGESKASPPALAEPPIADAMIRRTGHAEKNPTNPGGIGSRPGSGQPAGLTTSFFQVGVRAKTIVYVIDRSASMGLHRALAAAKTELIRSMNQLPEETFFQVIMYNRRANLYPSGSANPWLSASATTKAEVARALEAVEAEGATDHLAALRQALLLKPEALFFLTDADDLNMTEVQAVTRLNQGKTALHVIQLVSSRHEVRQSALPSLASMNHGSFRAFTISP